MWQYIVRRVLQMIPVIIGATFIIYAAVFALPGDPTITLCGERGCSPAVAEQIAERYHLNDPLPVGYVKYMGNVLKGDLGTNSYGIPVTSDLQNRYRVTGQLAGLAIAFEAVVGILAGVLAAIRKGKFLDYLVLASTLALISVPVFVVGSMSQYWFGVKWHLFPVTVPAEPAPGDLVLPALVLASISMAYVARLTRTNLAENLRADYVRTARAKGLSRGRIVGLHSLRNSLIPVITFIGYDFGTLLGGAIITERIFNIQGIGGYIFRGISTRDGFSVVGAVTALVLVYLVVNLLVDILYGILDPRISND